MPSIYVESVERLTPALYAELVAMNLRDEGIMRASVRAARRSGAISEVAVWMDGCRPLSWSLWSLTPRQGRRFAVQVYTPRRFRSRGYGRAVLAELVRRHPQAITFYGVKAIL